MKIYENYSFCSQKHQSTSVHFQNLFFWTLWPLLHPINKKLISRKEPRRVKNANMPLVVKKQKFQKGRRDMKFFSWDNFYRRCQKWAQNSQKFCNLTRERQFVHFWYFRVDSFHPSQTLQEYRRCHFKQKSRKKIGNIYGHSAIISVWNFKNCQNFKNYQNFKTVVETWIFFYWGNFNRRFRIWAQNRQKLCILTRERQFVHFWDFREDSSDHSQILREYTLRHS